MSSALHVDSRGAWNESSQKPLTIPVCYGGAFGPDVEASAEELGVSADRLIETHAGASYRVDFLGFSPGFGYLSGLPGELRLPRHATPRPRVPAGSVAIAEGRSAVYPSPTPGGWRLIGRTPWVMFDPHRDPPSLLQAGDAVRFERIDETTFDRLAKEAEAESAARREAALSREKQGDEDQAVIRVMRGGGPATVQDLGRFGYGDIGVAPSGAADVISLRLGNRLLGQPDGEAAIEMTLVGGVYRLEADAVVCLTGADAPRAAVRSGEGTQPIAMGQPLTVRAGDEVEVGPLEGGARAYLCVKGGLRTPVVLGSRSTHVPSGLGGVGRLLRDGDELAVARTSESSLAAWLSEAAPRSASEAIRPAALPQVVRIVPGQHRDRFPPELDVSLPSAEFDVDARSDRTGIRLRGAGVWEVDREGLESEAVSPGAVQVPPDGHPIVLGVDGPTVGGYPVLAQVIEADLPVLGQLRPGDKVRFAWVLPDSPDPPESSRPRESAAAEAMREREAWLDSLSSGYLADGLQRPVLACDAGEAEAGEARERELALLPHVALVNVACGGHAGDEASMREMVGAALAHGCAIGAHPSYPDRANFGRIAMDISAEGLRVSLVEQMAALRSVCDELGASIVCVKPHGALYHRASDDPEVGRAIAEAVREVWPSDASREVPAVVALWGSRVVERFREMGLRVWSEGFVDRAYEPDGSLRERGKPGAVITDPGAAAEQAQQLREGRVRATDSAWLSIDADVLTVHGDTPTAAEFVKLAKSALSRA
ncbi:MAG: 5-oxoprolinase subunit PxpB [Planctomycetota bacterium]